jgi:hypothetical protein
VSKKRRVTVDQARMLAISIINLGVTAELEERVYVLAPEELGMIYLKGNIPDRWNDGQTSDQSWDSLKEEIRIQLENIIDCLNEEARRIQKKNPEFHYYPF